MRTLIAFFLFGAVTVSPLFAEKSKEWTKEDIILYGSLASAMSEETFRFDSRTTLPDRSWWSVEIRKDSLKRPHFGIDAATGLAYERYTLREARRVKEGIVSSYSRIHTISLRKHYCNWPGNRLQFFGTFSAGIALEASQSTIKDTGNTYYVDVQHRDRLMFYPGFAMGIRLRPVPFAVIVGEARVHTFVHSTITPDLRLVYGAGFRF
jgi:hypothetical protein